MRTRVAASTLLGVTLVVLVALATVAVAALVWARAEDRARIEDDRAADVAREALQNSLGRVLTTLRVADGLVDEQGSVDPASFRAFAQAVTSMPGSGSLALAKVVRSPDRDRFEDASGVEIIEFVRTGVFRPAGERETYLPIVEVWPPTSANQRLLGLDLLSEPARRRTLTLARTTRQASFTELIPLAVGRQGLLAFKPLYAPGQSDRGPVAYISASFNTSVMRDVLDRLPEGLRVGVAVDGTTVYATSRSPSSGATRSLMLGGRRWVVIARGPSPSHTAPLAILFVGATLAALLAAFTRSRVSFERRLVRATESEREARQRSELLEAHAAHLAAAATSRDVALSTVADLSAAGIEIAAVNALHDGLVEVLANSGLAGELSQTEAYRLDTDTAATQAMRSGEIVEITSGDEYDRRFPDRAAARRRQHVESVIAVPLRNTDGRVIGALVAASRQPRWLNRSMRLVVTGVAEQCGLALERARLQSVDEEARRRADLLQRLTGELSAAALPTDVAEASVPYLFEAFGADLCSLGVAWGDDVRTIKFPSGIERDKVDWLPVPRSNSTPTADAIRSRAVIELHGAKQIARRYPPDVEVLMHGMESMLVLPLPGATGAVGVAFRKHRVLSVSERELLGQIAQELSQALDRAALLERERDARLHAELMEKNAAHLAASVGVTDVAAVTVADLEGAGFGIAAVCTSVPAGVEVVAVEGVSPDVVDALRESAFDDQTIIGDTLSTGRLVEVETAEALAARYPTSAELGRMLGAETLISIPLRASDRHVIGVLMVASHTPRSLDGGRRQVIHGVAEQCGLALERAQLQASAEHAAATATFLALVAEVVERPTRAGARARRLTDVLTEERATFAAVHFADDDRPPELVAVSGSLPQELVDDEEWSKQVSHAITTRRPVFPGFGAQSAGRADPPLVIVLPLRARGHTLGTLTLRTAADADWRPAIGLDLAREIAARASIALDNALLYEREREVSHSLQLGLLGGALPEFDGVVAAAAYRPGTATLEVGGDWYDAFRLPSGALGLVVGDVVGHGLEAAVAMGQLRGALSALAQTGAPSRILEQLDAFVETVPEAATATIAYVELDPASGRIQYACAGHPPPLVVSPDGHTRFLWEGRSAPLGSTLGDAREQATDVLEDGETLVLYTDGLVERRSESFDHGLARLAAASKMHPPDAPTLADDLCEALLDGHSQDDDVCVLTLHRLPTVSLYRHAMSADPAELAGLRESLRMWLDGLGVVDEESERSTVLAVSEAAANAIEHGYECDGVGTVIVTARLDGDDRLDITVRDEGGWRESDSEPDRGRGLAIMRAIVDEFSIARDNGGTVLRMSRSARETTSP